MSDDALIDWIIRLWELTVLGQAWLAGWMLEKAFTKDRSDET